MDTFEARARKRNNKKINETGPVLYWMQRDQRAEDNWSLLYAQLKAQERGVPLCVVFSMVTSFVNAGLRHYDFLFKGLKEVESDLGKRNIPFYVLEGEPDETIPKFVSEHSIGEVVCDFNPLRFTDAWRTTVGESVDVQVTEVDGRNIIPCWVASDKEEFAAHTFRPKVHRQLTQFLTKFPSLHEQYNFGDFSITPVDYDIKRSRAPVQYKNFFIVGYTGIFNFTGDRNMAKIAYHAGVGEKNSQGFGMIKILI